MKKLILLACSVVLIQAAVSAQCPGGPIWVGGPNPPGSLSDNATMLGIVTVHVQSQGSFQAGRPGYGYANTVWNGHNFNSLNVYRGASFAAGTFTYFKLNKGIDSNYIHLRVRDIRGDGFNTEHQRVQGFRNGVPVAATFKELLNNATITGGNVINGWSGTTALVQSSARAFFNGPVDSIVVTATALSDFIVMDLFARCDILLPFKTISFSARQTNNNILLEWQSTAETGFTHYDIERSSNSRDWEKIGELPAGDASNFSNSYQFTDSNPLLGKNFYRLKTNDIDGGVTFSKVISVNFVAGQSQIAPFVFPNPFDREIRISEKPGADPVSSIRIYNYNSQLVREIHMPTRNATIPTEGWIPGTYMVRITTTKGLEYTYKLIKR